MMLLLKSEVLDLLTDHLCLFEADLTTLKFTFVSKPLETVLGYDVQGELSGKPVDSVLPGLLGAGFLAAPSPATVHVSANRRDGGPGLATSVLILPRATATAGRVVVGVVVTTPPLTTTSKEEGEGGGVK